jgi:hypothetical protein
VLNGPSSKSVHRDRCRIPLTKQTDLNCLAVDGDLLIGSSVDFRICRSLWIEGCRCTSFFQVKCQIRFPATVAAVRCSVVEEAHRLCRSRRQIHYRCWGSLGFTFAFL